MRPSNNSAFASGALALFLLPLSASAQTYTAGGLEEVFVTASRYHQKVQESPTSISLIDERALLRTTAFGAADLLRDISGLQVTDSGQAGLKRIRIRGEESRRTAILIDSLELTDPYEVGVPLTLDPAMLERVEIIRGSGSVLYGSRALSGVVNFITRKGGTKPLQATVSATYDGSSSGWGGFASVYGNADGLEYRLAYSERDYKERETPQGAIENTRFDNRGVSLYLGKTVADAFLEYRFDNYEASAEVFVEEEVRTSFPLTDFGLNTPRRDRFRHAVSYRQQGTSDAINEFKFDMFYQESDRLFLTRTETIWYERDIRSESTLFSTGGVAQLDVNPAPDHRVIAGLQYLGDEVDQKRLVDTFSWTPTTPSGIEVISDEARIDTLAVFIQDEWQATPAVSITAGLRQYYVEAELEDTNRSSLEAGSLDDDSELIGSLAAVYEASDTLHLRALAAQGYVYPSLLQLATGAYAGSSYVNPAPDLKPETSDNLELGLRWERGGVALDVTAFYSTSDDYISQLPCTPEDLCPGRRDRLYQNVGKSRAHGIEWQAQYSSADSSLSPYVNLTWMKRRNEFADFSTWDTGVPEVAGIVGLRWEGEGSYGVRFWTDTYLRGETASELMEPGSSRTVVENRSSWLTLNIASGLQFGRNQQFNVVLELQNLADESYITSGENLLSPQRSASVKFTADF